MKIDSKSIKMWSRVGSRATFGMAAVELAKECDELMVLTSDVSTSAGLERYRRTYPEKFLDVGIAEQNLIGIAAGLASEGKLVVTATFAPFQTMRCCEQIRVNLGYMGHKVCMVGLASGLALGTLGYTHCCFEDMAVMRAIPNMTVLSPADCGETVNCLVAALEHNGPVYLRLSGANVNPPVYKDDYDFQIGKAVTLREGADITVFATGTMVHQALGAAEILAESGVDAAVVDMHTIKPIDQEAIKAASERSKLLVSVEEHNVVGGLGSAIAEYSATLCSTPRQVFIGIPDAYGKAGEYPDLLEKYELTAPQIAARIKAELR